MTVRCVGYLIGLMLAPWACLCTGRYPQSTWEVTHEQAAA